jgi:hypothetical protein
MSVCRTWVGTVASVAERLPAEGVPEIVAAYAMDGCLLDSCGSFVDDTYHEASNDLQRLVDAPYSRTVQWTSSTGKVTNVEVKSVQSRLGALIVTLIGRHPFGCESLMAGGFEGDDHVSMRMDPAASKATAHVAMRSVLRARLSLIATSRRPRGARYYLGHFPEMNDRRGFRMPQGDEGDIIWFFCWWLLNRLGPGYNMEIDRASSTIFFSGASETKLRELVPNLLE